MHRVLVGRAFWVLYLRDKLVAYVCRTLAA